MFSAFSPLAGGNDFGAFGRPAQSPFRNRGEDAVRPQHNINGPFPYPLLLGYVSGFSPMQNAAEYHTMQGRSPFGPWVGALPSTPAQLSKVFPDLTGALRKVKG